MDFKATLQNARNKLLRRGSATTTTSRASIASNAGSDRAPKSQGSTLRKSISMTKLPETSAHEVDDESDQRLSKSAILLPHKISGTEASLASSLDNNTLSSAQPSPVAIRTACPELTIEEPTPIPLPVSVPEPSNEPEEPSDLRPPPTRKPTPPAVVRRQSLVTSSNAKALTKLLEPDIPRAAIASGPPTADYFGTGAPTFNASMLHRKIWVKRPNASATLVQIREDDLVDDVRDMILRKYANSLGRNFDPPDVTLRIHARDSNSKSGDRILGPEEEMCRTLDAYFPGGQTVSEALLIDVPQRIAPKASPRLPAYYSHQNDLRPVENSTDYFPPMHLMNPTNPSPATTIASHDTRGSLPHAPHSIAVLQTGQLAPLPSPGGTTRRGHHAHGRPKNPRHNTASPTTLTGSVPSSATTSRPPNRPRHDSSASDSKQSTSGNPPIPTPPIVDSIARQNSAPPTPRLSSPRPEKPKRKKPKAELSLPAGLLDNSVPPINVLIVEDNIINLRVLGAFMQRLKVRWQRAMNGKEAVTKWRAGGFHLVLMDIQLPIMNGLEATKEIRRLERVNSIGVFSSGSAEAPNQRLSEDPNYGKDMNEDDKLGDKGLFKSPVIIVALTASSLQSDRHEALAAGCNDFLTKPVNFVWLERKVKEWGCMQALIDFDGWRRWKDFAAQSDTADGASKISTSYSSIAPKSKSNNLSPISAANGNGNTGPTAANGITSTPKPKDEERKSKRRSLGIVPPPALPEEESTASTSDTVVP